MFEGLALVRVRANVKHDSFERLLDVSCPAYQIRSASGSRWISAVPPVIDNLEETGVGLHDLQEAAKQDPALAEFCRFYLERRDAEVRAAGEDKRKAARLAEEFTPNLEMEVVGLEGDVCRAVRTDVSYTLDQSQEYTSQLSIDPRAGRVYEGPAMGSCVVTGRALPVDCLSRCDISGTSAQTHLLVKSALSGRVALPEFTATCAVTGRTILSDEGVVSSVTGAVIGRDTAATSEVSGRVAEPQFVDGCAFTATKALKSELSVSELSGKLYRIDQKTVSAHSGKSGHSSEFLECPVTRTVVAASEAEICEETMQRVRPGVLVACADTGRRVVPDLLGYCEETGKRVLKARLATSSISGASLLQSAGLQARSGEKCLSSEGVECAWSGELSHPRDLVRCSATGLAVRSEYTDSGSGRLKPLSELLDGMRHGTSHADVWPGVASVLSASMKGVRCTIEAATLSPDGRRIAVRGETKAFLGLRTNRVGAVCSLSDCEVIGRIAIGRATRRGWEPVA